MSTIEVNGNLYRVRVADDHVEVQDCSSGEWRADPSDINVFEYLDVEATIRDIAYSIVVGYVML